MKSKLITKGAELESRLNLPLRPFVIRYSQLTVLGPLPSLFAAEAPTAPDLDQKAQRPTKGPNPKSEPGTRELRIFAINDFLGPTSPQKRQIN